MTTPRYLSALTLAAATTLPTAFAHAQVCNQPFPGDTNGDLVVDFDDLNNVLNAWGTPGPVGDVDGSGFVDFQDLNLVLANWGNTYCAAHRGIDAWELPGEGLMLPPFGSASLPPIPPNFFGPGSDPFFGNIPLPGGFNNPLQQILDPTYDPFVDTVVQRLDCIEPPVVGTDQIVPIQIVELNLTSVQPITVTFGGAPTQWDVWVELSVPTEGTYSIDFNDPTTGIGGMNIPVIPRFTFAPHDQVGLVIEGLIPPEDLQIVTLDFASHPDFAGHLVPLISNPDHLIGPPTGFWVGCSNAPQFEWSETKPYAWP